MPLEDFVKYAWLEEGCLQGKQVTHGLRTRLPTVGSFVRPVIAPESKEARLPNERTDFF